LKPHERLLLILTFLYALTVVSLSAYGENRLDLYISLYTLEYFVVVLLHSPLNPKTQKVINLIGYGLFVIFMIIVIRRIMGIIVGGSS